MKYSTRKSDTVATTIPKIVILLSCVCTSISAFQQPANNRPAIAAGKSLDPTLHNYYQNGRTAIACNAKKRKDVNDDEMYQMLSSSLSTQQQQEKGQQKQQQSIAFKNEFSRTLSPERILKTRPGSGSSNSNSYSKDYVMEIKATEEECKALAKRFDLSDIAKLEASLSLRREALPGSGGSTSGGSNTGGTSRSYNSQAGIQVDGNVMATVTQTCVRTNEKFQVELEFPLNCRVRAVPPLWMDAADIDEIQHQQQQSYANKKKAKKDRANGGSTNIQQIDMMELQRLLEDIDIREEDVVMEDQAIYTINGMLDVGELVAQLFCLQLDPYPKKPGSGPIQASISG